VDRRGARRGALGFAAVELFAVVVAVYLDGAAHLVEAGAEADADAVFERLFRGVAAGVHVVGGEDGQPLVVVALADDVHHRVAHPVGRLRRAQLVQDQDLGLIDRREHAHLGGVRDLVVRVLNLFEQRAELVEQTRHALLHQALQDGDGEVRLPHPDRPHQQEPALDRRVLPDEAEGVVERLQLRAVVGRGVVVLQRAGFAARRGGLAVAARDARLLHQLRACVLRAALAAARAAVGDDFEARPVTALADRGSLGPLPARGLRLFLVRRVVRLRLPVGDGEEWEVLFAVVRRHPGSRQSLFAVSAAAGIDGRGALARRGKKNLRLKGRGRADYSTRRRDCKTLFRVREFPQCGNPFASAPGRRSHKPRASTAPAAALVDGPPAPLLPLVDRVVVALVIRPLDDDLAHAVAVQVQLVYEVAV